MVDLNAVTIPRVCRVRQQWRIVTLVNAVIWVLIVVGLWTALDTLVGVWRRQ